MNEQHTDELYMARCIQIATNGLGNTYPNPFVGSVIVHQNQIIGEGFTSAYGGSHAEVNAINSVKNQNLLEDSTLFVSLEPCAHFGKTPPCCDLIIQKKIPRVVVGTLDPFAKVNGEGIKRMQANGIDVKVGILEKDCLELNRRFFTFHQKKRPYIILKWAETADAFFSPKSAEQKWITNAYSKQLVHWWRTQEQAILVGKNTALIDNPQLNARLINKHSPIRLLIDQHLQIPNDFHLYDQSVKSIIFNSIKDEIDDEIYFKQIDFNQNILPQVLKILYQENIQSVIVEGGVKTLNAFIEQNIWDEARILSSNEFWNDGIKSPELKGSLLIQKTILNDKLRIIRNDG